VANKAHAFRDRDVRRLVKAARAAGLNPTAIEVDIKASRIRVIDSKHDEAMSHD
jgi:Tfp pilus assembly PilM family ATPase